MGRIIGATAERDLRKMQATIRERIQNAIAALADEPRPPGCQKLRGANDRWRIRVGDYRISHDHDEQCLSPFCALRTAVRFIVVMRIEV